MTDKILNLLKVKLEASFCYKKRGRGKILYPKSIYSLSSLGISYVRAARCRLIPLSSDRLQHLIEANSMPFKDGTEPGRKLPQKSKREPRQRMAVGGRLLSVQERPERGGLRQKGHAVRQPPVGA